MITAAHCLQDKSMLNQGLTVVAGLHSQSRPNPKRAQRKAVLAIQNHPEYNDFDIKDKTKLYFSAFFQYSFVRITSRYVVIIFSSQYCALVFNNNHSRHIIKSCREYEDLHIMDISECSSNNCRSVTM